MSDIDKVYDLMEKVYVELQDTKKEVKNNSQRLDNLESGQNKLEHRMGTIDNRMSKIDNRMSKIETTLEHDIKAKLQALHERTGDNTVKLGEHTERLESIENKIDILAMSINSQDKRLEVVESRHKKAK